MSSHPSVPSVYPLSGRRSTDDDSANHCIGVSAPPLWNRLPITVRTSKDVLTRTFKRTLKQKPTRPTFIVNNQ